jgi:hypothetical protein
MTTAHDDHRRIARSLSQLRRAIIREFAFDIVRVFGGDDVSLPQLATMLLLDDAGAETIKGVAEALGRYSATSRLLDDVVKPGLIVHADERDSPVERVAITARVRQFIAAIEQRRAGVQLAAKRLLTPKERGRHQRYGACGRGQQRKGAATR